MTSETQRSSQRSDANGHRIILQANMTVGSGDTMADHA